MKNEKTKTILVLSLSFFVFISAMTFYPGFVRSLLPEPVSEFLHLSKGSNYIGDEQNFAELMSKTLMTNGESYKKTFADEYGLTPEKAELFDGFIKSSLGNEKFLKLMYHRLKASGAISKDGYVTDRSMLMKMVRKSSQSLIQELVNANLEYLPSEYKKNELLQYLTQIKYYREHRHFRECRAFVTGDFSKTDMNEFSKLTFRIFNSMPDERIRALLEGRTLAVTFALKPDLRRADTLKLTDEQRTYVSGLIGSSIRSRLDALPYADRVRIEKALGNIGHADDMDACDAGELITEAYFNVGEADSELALRFYFEK